MSQRLKYRLVFNREHGVNIKRLKVIFKTNLHTTVKIKKNVKIHHTKQRKKGITKNVAYINPKLELSAFPSKEIMKS
jgi:hypothetical protein